MEFWPPSRTSHMAIDCGGPSISEPLRRSTSSAIAGSSAVVFVFVTCHSTRTSSPFVHTVAAVGLVIVADSSDAFSSNVDTLFVLNET